MKAFTNHTTRKCNFCRNCVWLLKADFDCITGSWTLLKNLPRLKSAKGGIEPASSCLRDRHAMDRANMSNSKVRPDFGLHSVNCMKFISSSLIKQIDITCGLLRFFTFNSTEFCPKQGSNSQSFDLKGVDKWHMLNPLGYSDMLWTVGKGVFNMHIIHVLGKNVKVS